MMLKYIFSSMLFVHGLIHFMGFAKAFNYSNFSQLSKEISKPSGVLWFVTAILFVLSVILFLFKKEAWVYFALIAILLSEFLILNNWHDAKFGTIANAIILLFTVIGFFQINFKNVYRSEVKIGLLQSTNIPKTILTEALIKHLPEPVQKYIRYANCIGKPIVNNFSINFSGKIRSHEKPVWMYLTSEQYNFIPSPTRLFF